MALPKTFTAGERLFAEDLNEALEYLEGEDLALDARVTILENATLAVDTASSNTVNLDFSNDRLVLRAATGSITFTGSNYTAGKSVTVRVVSGGSSRDLSFPADWKFVSFKPLSIAANKTGVLAVTSFGTSAADCVAAWAVEA